MREQGDHREESTGLPNGQRVEKKRSNFAKQEICLSLEKKLRRKPGKKDQVDLFINKNQEKTP